MLRKVEGLIDPVTGGWDEVQLRDLFIPIDVQRILQIPISLNLEDDFVAWHKSKKGKFATGHRYFLAFAETHRSIVSLLGTITIL